MNENPQQEPAERHPAASSADGAPEEDNSDAARGGAVRLRRRLRVLPAVALALLLAVAVYVVLDAWMFMTTPPEKNGRDVTVQIRPGSTFIRVAWQLRQAGAITDVTRFRLLGMYRKQTGAVHAGEFLVNTGWTPGRVLDAVVNGSPVVHPLALREGLPWWEVARLVEQGSFARYEDFRAVIHDPEFLGHWKIPFDSAEGYLFPETYMLQRPPEMNRASARAVADMLVSMFYRKSALLWSAQAPEHDAGVRQDEPQPEELGRLVILASLVEKETGLPSERERIAGVYAARLRRGMLMQCDPTVIYGLGESFDGNLTRTHLRDAENPYNTYRHKGLPPGPICSPGLDSLAAALRPEQHNYLYFVSRGDGSHHFSSTLTEHNRAVRKYQLGR
jgi:UPF0755 protein